MLAVTIFYMVMLCPFVLFGGLILGFMRPKLQWFIGVTVTMMLLNIVYIMMFIQDEISGDSLFAALVPLVGIGTLSLVMGYIIRAGWNALFPKKVDKE